MEVWFVEKGRGVADGLPVMLHASSLGGPLLGGGCSLGQIGPADVHVFRAARGFRRGYSSRGLLGSTQFSTWMVPLPLVGHFPDYELPDHTDKLRKLSELQGEDPLILTLARGHYFPKEHQQHLELAAFYPKIAVAYTQI
jgi:hypothetical protein